MKHCAFLGSLIALASLTAVPARAQLVGNLDPSQTYLAVTDALPPRPGSLCNNPFCITPSVGIPLSYYATSTSVAGQMTGLSNQIVNLSNQINTEFSSFNSQMTSQFSKVYQGVAISAAMGDAIPNPGDRFAVRVNTAGFDDQAAGAISFTYAFQDNARVSVNMGRADRKASSAAA